MKSKTKTKVCHIASFLNYSLFFEALGQFPEKEKYEVSFIFLNPEVSPIEKLLAERGHRVEHVAYTSRKQLLSAILQLRRLLNDIGPDIVHTHLADASLAGMIAAKTAGFDRRLHTRHHSTECHVYYPHAVYYDRLINRLSSRIIATTGIVKETLLEREGAPSDKVRLITYGYDLSRFENDEGTTAEIGRKYHLDDHYPVVGVISRFVEWKGIQFIIPAFAKLTERYPKAKLVLANAAGNFSPVLDAMLEKELRPDQFAKIEFEPKIFDLYKNFDLFVHVPITRDAEAFGQTYIEALYSEVPSVFTVSGIAHDFIRHREHALIVPYCDSGAIHRAMESLLEDEGLRASIVEKGRAEVMKRFEGAILATDLDELYDEMMAT
jgi:glycosyltransferase involved in cell wall biosynthesis